MKALVVCGSMRKNGNTDILADEFIKGANEAGHEAEKVSLRDLRAWQEYLGGVIYVSHNSNTNTRKNPRRQGRRTL